MNTKTKLTALLMSVLMIVAMIPAFALNVAADPVYVVEVTLNGTTTQYESFADGWAVAVGTGNTSGATVKLLKDTDMGATAAHASIGRGAQFNKYITLDLNGCVLLPPTAGPNGAAFTDGLTGVNHFCINGTAGKETPSAGMTIMDSNPTVQHWYYEKDNSGLYVWDDAKQYDGQAGYTYYMIPGGALTGGRQQVKDDVATKINNKKAGAISNYCGSLTITGGNFIGNVGIDSGAIRNEGGNSRLNMSGGLFIGNTCIAGGKGYHNFCTINGFKSGSITGGTFVSAQKDGGVFLYTDGLLPEGYVFAPDVSYANGYTFGPDYAAVVYDSNNAVVGQYMTLKEAWDKAEEIDNCTVKLLKDCSAAHDSFTRDNGNKFENRGMILHFGKTLTLDLNGHVLTPPTVQVDGTTDATGISRVIWVFRYATLKIKDSNPTAVHKYTADDKGFYTLNEKEGTIEIPGGVITGGNADTGSLHAKGGGAIFAQGGQVIVEGGNFIGNKGTDAGAICLISGDQNDLPEAFKKEGMTIVPGVKISGGYFVGNTAKYSKNRDVQSTTPLNTTDANKDAWATSVLTGGKFNGIPKGLMDQAADIVADGYKFYEIGDGMLELTSKGYAAAVYDSNSNFVGNFETLKEAWDKAEELDNCTVKLLANCNAEHDTFVRTSLKADGVTVNDPFVNRGMILGFGKTLTLDLNGFVVTPPTKKVDGTDATGVSRVFWVLRYATLKIKDSNPTAVHKYTDVDGLYKWDDVNGTIELPGGAITGGNAGTGSLHVHAGGAVLVQGGNLIIEGGNIVGNTGQGGHGGGAINLSTGDLVDLDPAFIKPGIQTILPALTITGGTFIGNKASYANGTDINAKQNFEDVNETKDKWATSGISGGSFSNNLSGLIIAAPSILTSVFSEITLDAATGRYVVSVKSEAVVVDGVTHHMVVVGTPIASTCAQEGTTGARKCIDAHDGTPCTYVDQGVSIPKLPHEEVTDVAIAPTCTTTGKTEGSHCAICNSAIVPQEDVPALGHTAGAWTETKAATETEAGKEVKKCTVCDEIVEEREIAALGSQTEEPTTPATQAPTTPATQAPTTSSSTNEEGCASVVGSAAGMILVALLGGCVICRKKED